VKTSATVLFEPDLTSAFICDRSCAHTLSNALRTDERFCPLTDGVLSIEVST
jgi:hypothetical protein